MFRIYILLVVLLAVGGVGYGAFYYYQDTQKRIAQLQENNAKLEVANQTNQKTIKKMMENAEQLNALTNKLEVKLRKAEEYGDELRATLNKHDLTHLANKKPGMIEKRMQNATDELWTELESITGDNTTN